MNGLVCLVGPPAVGKSTISQALADRGAVQVFRLREFAQQVREREPQAARLFTTSDPLGWFGDGAVAFCLRRAFVDGWVSVAGLVVLENLPGNGVQMGQVHAVASLCRVPLAVVELAAPEEVLLRRAADRRVCPSCEPDPYGDPHRPAQHRRQEPDVCAGCGGQLVGRRSDRPAVFAARLNRFRERIGGIRRGATTRGRPLHTIDATGSVPDCLDRVLAVCQATVGQITSMEVPR